jgi:hypothetical protein
MRLAEDKVGDIAFVAENGVYHAVRAPAEKGSHDRGTEGDTEEYWEDAA